MGGIFCREEDRAEFLQFTVGKKWLYRGLGEWLVPTVQQFCCTVGKVMPCSGMWQGAAPTVNCRNQTARINVAKWSKRSGQSNTKQQKVAQPGRSGVYSDHGGHLFITENVMPYMVSFSPSDLAITTAPHMSP